MTIESCFRLISRLRVAGVIRQEAYEMLWEALEYYRRLQKGAA